MWIDDKIQVPENSIEIRCPGKFKKLFLVLRQEHMPKDSMLMEIACADCAKAARSNGAVGLGRFLHYYNSTGQCVANKIVPVTGQTVPLWIEN